MHTENQSMPPSPQRAVVSVVIPVKNDSAVLGRCLRALGAQTRPADEIIVVDNGSSDDSVRTAEVAGATVIYCPEPGIPAASSRGYDFATGDLIFRLDADCVPPESWIASSVNYFAHHTDVSVLTGPARFIDGPAAIRVPLSAIYLSIYTLMTAPALGHRPLFGSNFAMRREVWQSVRTSVHRDDPELHDDLDLSFHIGERHHVQYLKSEAMGMSMRPFRSMSSFRRRTYRGFRTVTVHWPRDFPPHRWFRMVTLQCRSRLASLGLTHEH
ncbi:glycosyltransferase family 2 protein [Arthrobacter sp. TMP15]|uniref:glycosyltransferase n=1 Tax=Arthrobacter sp. TMP15 TaxID=3140789 RepID=UPI0031BA42D6